MKKQIIACYFLFCLCSQAKTQPYKVPVASGINELEIIISNAYLDIEGYDGNEILITSKREKKIHKRAQGLRALNQNGVDNTGVGINFEQSNDRIKLLKVSKREEGNFFMQVPKNLDLIVKEEEWYGEEISVVNMASAITVLSNNADVTLKNISGPVSAKTTSGDILTTFSKELTIQASKISSVSGTVEVYLPQNLSADLDISSISGDVYSDFDLDYQNKKDHRGLEKIGGGKSTKASINGGGIKLELSSISDDVYVRKEKRKN